MPPRFLDFYAEPWWALFGSSLLADSPFPAVLRQFWAQKLDRLKEHQDFKWNALAAYAGMTYNQLNARIVGKHFGDTSLPVHELILFAAATGLELSDILPSQRELFNTTTSRLVSNYEQSTDEDLALAPGAIEAYVEYFLSKPTPQIVSRELDDHIVQETHDLVSDHFKTPEDTRRCIRSVCEAIRDIYWN